MGKLYKRVGQPAKKECDNCNTVWDDKQLFNDQHQYGTTNCPFCHTPWEVTEIIKLPSLVMRKTARMEQKLYKLQEQISEIDGALVKLESTPLACGVENEGSDWALDHTVGDQSDLIQKHSSDLRSMSTLHSERLKLIAKVTEIESSLAEEVTFIPEPEGIRLKSGQMDWDVAYANFRAYRDKR